MNLDLIPDDGYTERGYLRAVPGLHGDLRFEYRPMLQSDRTVLLRGLARLPDDQQDGTAANAMAERIVSWSLKGKDGQTAPVKAATILRLKPALFGRLWAIIAGLEPSDADPERTTDAAAKQAQDALTAAIAGRTLADLREDKAAGNS